MKRIVFLTGTRADFGKIKPLIQAVSDSEGHRYSLFVTGMHLLYRYGLTVDEIHKAGFTDVFTFSNQTYGEPMEMILANTISGFSKYIHEIKPDLIVIHGDRVEALAGATVGALSNTLVLHIEGGERSGTVDELIRHAVSKLSHIHFVANEIAKKRLIQLGETPNTIHITGSPDIDIMLSSHLPTLEEVKQYYELEFEKYAIVLFHSVTTEVEEIAHDAKVLVDTLLESKMNYIVIYPNNDSGCDFIFKAYERLNNRSNVKVFSSIRFESFLTLLKNARFIIGNSSSGVRQAPVYGTPSINIGNRQNGRFSHESIIKLAFDKTTLLKAIKQLENGKKMKPCQHFGKGKSAQLFIEAIQGKAIWSIPKQKTFCDYEDINLSP